MALGVDEPPTTINLSRVVETGAREVAINSSAELVERNGLSVSRKDHSLLEEQASIPARLASVDDGISFARTFIELFAR
jgi:hypothetical protein